MGACARLEQPVARALSPQPAFSRQLVSGPQHPSHSCDGRRSRPRSTRRARARAAPRSPSRRGSAGSRPARRQRRASSSRGRASGRSGRASRARASPACTTHTVQQLERCTECTECTTTTLGPGWCTVRGSVPCPPAPCRRSQPPQRRRGLLASAQSTAACHEPTCSSQHAQRRRLKS